MKGYYLVIENVRSYFSIESEIYTCFLKKYILANEMVFTKEKFILLLEENINFLLRNTNLDNKGIKSSRFKIKEYKGDVLYLNLNNSLELLIFDLINLYYSILEVNEDEKIVIHPDCTDL